MVTIPWVVLVTVDNVKYVVVVGIRQLWHIDIVCVELDLIVVVGALLLELLRELLCELVCELLI